MNKSIKITSFFVLIIFNVCFPDRFKDLFTTENAKITTGFVAIGTAVPVAIKSFRNWRNATRNDSGKTDIKQKKEQWWVVLLV